MPRRSLKTERTEEILDAFERCILKHGMQGSSLERIAEEAGMGRTILRHYIGNRDDLIIAVTDRFVADSINQFSGLINSLPISDRIDALLTILFQDDESFDMGRSRIADALIAEATRLEKVRDLLGNWFDGLVSLVEHELRNEYRAVAMTECRAAALGIISTYFVIGSLQPMTASPAYRATAQKAAKQLVSSLKK
ncbi:MAG: TetR/AcrR family transcriptional regulator [Cyanobacteria bacterium P01_F01_bin.150]